MILNKEYLYKLAASGFGAGYMPVAPGTAGSLLGILLYLPFSGLTPAYYIILLIVLTFLSMKVSGEAERYFKRKDCSIIIVDEVAGIFYAMFLLPPSVMNLLLVFVLFRFFDIMKPFPAGLINSEMKGGAGVVLDDIVAGIYANISVRILGGIYLSHV